MKIGPFSNPSAAYQLHYYFCFRTKRNKRLFTQPNHLVLDIQRHVHVFDDVTGKALIDYWLRVAEKKKFQIAQIRVLPNQVGMRNTSGRDCRSWA